VRELLLPGLLLGLKDLKLSVEIQFLTRRPGSSCRPVEVPCDLQGVTQGCIAFKISAGASNPCLK